MAAQVDWFIHILDDVLCGKTDGRTLSLPSSIANHCLTRNTLRLANIPLRPTDPDGRKRLRLRGSAVQEPSAHPWSKA